MKYVKLVFWLAVFVPFFYLACEQSWSGLWYGRIVGVLLGVFFGLMIGGNPDWKLWNPIFGPKEAEEEEAGKPSGSPLSELGDFR